MVEISGQTMFGDEKFLRLYIRFEGLAASLQNSLIYKQSLDFWYKFAWFYCPQFEISQADCKNCIMVLEKTKVKNNKILKYLQNPTHLI